MDVNALTRSIDCFRGAIRKDPQFALAHYRLGQAYLSDGQPRTAADSFRDSVHANPNFVAGHIALAETLYNIPAYYYLLPAAAPPNLRMIYVDQRGGERDQREARDVLERVISELQSNVTVSWRAAAYLGLCQQAFQRTLSSSDLRMRYLAFFYCRRAEYLYSRLPSVLRFDSRIKDKEMLVLYYLGIILKTSSTAGSEKVNEKYKDWFCEPDATVDPFSGYHQAAEHYYKLALEKQPDDPSIRCGYATLSWAEKNEQPMIDLNLDETAHLVLADRLVEQAEKLVGQASTSENLESAEKLYRGALNETATAILLAPFSARARNQYAYYAWKWYWAWIRHESANGPSSAILDSAADQAREATRLTEDKGLRVEHGIYKSSLGEVLLAAGKFDEALTDLKEIVNPLRSPGVKGKPGLPDVGSQATFDEIRWDLAQAYVCASPKSGSSKQRQDLANEQLNAISQHESVREDQRFFGMLKVEELSKNCNKFGKDATSRKVAPH
jgi:tetratricopeptide (TPR) repeat protein